jgi:cytochrome c-type biogenesis protein CcmH/NrfF
MRALASFIFLALFSTALAAAEAQPIAADPLLEARVNRLSEELRCLVCQNQTLADSHAPLAVDLKNQVRDMMRAGRSDAEVVKYMVDRYGEFVLYRPPVKGSTLLLWLGPALLGLGSLAFLVLRIRAMSREAPPEALDPAAAERADQLLDNPPAKERP